MSIFALITLLLVIFFETSFFPAVSVPRLHRDVGEQLLVELERFIDTF